MPSFGEIIDQTRILLCVGSGGVGKTTTAAALALEAAVRGRKALVLTIDPAKRLANSLGLSALGHDVQRVPAARVDEAARDVAGSGGRATGELHAMMLDQKRAFDEMVSRYASDPEAVQRILKNPVYQQISRSLAGSQEYAALTKLQAFTESGDYDLIVVDTPPTAHALDFLDAPQKLTDAIDSPAVEWFRKMQGGGGWSMVGKSGGYVLKRLAKFVGSRFLDDLAIFFTEFNDILGGFRQRAEEVFGLLRQPGVGFVLVASPEAMAIREALFFHRRLIDSGMPFSGFVVNKVHQDRPVTVQQEEIIQRLAAVPEVAALGYQETTLRMATEALCASHRELQALAAADQRAIASLRGADGDALLVEVPFFERDIYDVAALGKLGRYLLA